MTALEPDDDDLARTHRFIVDEDDFITTSVRRSHPTIDVPDWGERTHIFEGERLSEIHAAIDEVRSSKAPPVR